MIIKPRRTKEKITFKQYVVILLKYWIPFTGRFFPEVKKVGEVVEKVKKIKYGNMEGD
jgi:hypothetical protein